MNNPDFDERLAYGRIAECEVKRDRVGSCMSKHFGEAVIASNLLCVLDERPPQTLPLQMRSYGNLPHLDDEIVLSDEKKGSQAASSVEEPDMKTDGIIRARAFMVDGERVQEYLPAKLESLVEFRRVEVDLARSQRHRVVLD